MTGAMRGAAFYGSEFCSHYERSEVISSRLPRRFACKEVDERREQETEASLLAMTWWIRYCLFSLHSVNLNG